MSQPVDLPALRAVLEKMTPGELTVENGPRVKDWSLDLADGTTVAYCTNSFPEDEIGPTPIGIIGAKWNADALCALRNAAPALLTELEQLRRERANLRADLQIDDRAVVHANEKRQEAERELEQLRAQVATLMQDRDSWQQAAENRAQDQTILERKLEAVTAELRGQTA